jgi:hypothetical protein
MRFKQAVPVMMWILLFNATLTSLSFSIRLTVVGLMISVVLFAVFLKKKEDREKPASRS